MRTRLGRVARGTRHALVIAPPAQSGSSQSLRDWSLSATTRGAAVGLAAGVAGGAVSLATSRLAEGHWNARGAATWVVGGAIAGALLGSAPREHEWQSRPTAVINTTFVVGSVLAAAAATPGLMRAGRAVWSGGVRDMGRELVRAGILGAGAFAATAAAASIAVPMGMPQHFEVTRR